MTKTFKRFFAVMLAVVVAVAYIPFFNAGTGTGMKAGAATVYKEGNYQYTVLGSWATITGYTDVPVTLSIPSKLDKYTVTAIGDEAFKNKMTLLNVKIPDTVKSIGDQAFYNCSLLSTVTLGSGVTSIGDYAFGRCLALTDITIPKSVLTIGVQAFAYDKAMTKFIVESGNVAFSEHSGVLFDAEKTKLIAYPAKRSGKTFTVPSTVTALGDASFSMASNLETLTLDSKLKTIGAYAFAESGISEVDMSGCSNLTTINAYAFKECKSIKTITLPSTVTSVKEGAFSDCKNLKTVSCSVKMTEISDKLFSGDSSLSKLLMPNTIKSIGASAFKGCTSIGGLSFSDDLKTVGAGAFENCTSLSAITFGKGLETCPGSAFSGCKSLSSIKVTSDDFAVVDGVLMNAAKSKIILYPAALDGTSYSVPSSVTRIGSNAFDSCKNLKTLKIPATVTKIDDNAVVNCGSLVIQCAEGSQAEEYFKNNKSGYGSLKTNGTSPTISVADVTAKADDTVEVKISISNNPGIVSAAFTLKYDATKVKYVSAKNGTILDKMTDKDAPLSSSCKFSFTSDDAKKDVKTNGVLVTVTFKLLSTFTSGTADLSITMDSTDTYNIDLESVKFNTESGKISVGGGASSSSGLGDVNGDGEINGKDATTLRRYVAGWSNIKVNKDACDVNGDGAINGKDATTLRRYVAGWSGVKLGK
ncbi:MAG: leucine-rich repeat protein [Clostridiales bacterium]|nr:leucine-rich repeat protein [Clostridiales bacterium]